MEVTCKVRVSLSTYQKPCTLVTWPTDNTDNIRLLTIRERASTSQQVPRIEQGRYIYIHKHIYRESDAKGRWEPRAGPPDPRPQGCQGRVGVRGFPQAGSHLLCFFSHVEVFPQTALYLCVAVMTIVS